MIRKTAFSLAAAFVLFACNSNQPKAPVTNVEVATTFIRAVLDDDFKTAEKYLLKDETNQQYFENSRRQYEGKDKSELEKYKSSEILINTLKEVNDSVTLVNYSNTYKKDNATDLKLLRRNGQWFIDFKYTFVKE
ncbi:hypothetical protein [Ferruginibacter sp.]